MKRLMHEEMIMNRVVTILREDINNNEALNEARTYLNELQLNIKNKENNKHLEMREHLMRNIVDTNIAMNEECNSILENETNIISEMEIISKNLYEWICEIENDIAEMQFKFRQTSYSSNLETLTDLLEEIQLFYQMLLTTIHEFNASMIGKPDTKRFLDICTEMREKSVINFRTLLELFANRPNNMINDLNVDIRLEDVVKSSSIINNYNYGIIGTTWNDNLQLLQKQFCSYVNSSLNQNNETNKTRLELFGWSSLMERITARIEHLIKYIHENRNMNYEEELNLLLESLSELECDNMEISLESHNQLKELKVKLTELEDLIGNRNPNSQEEIKKCSMNCENYKTFDFERKLTFSQSIQNNHEEFTNMSIDISQTEKYFIDIILTANEMSLCNPNQNNRSINIKINQYKELLRSFHCLIAILKVYVFNNNMIILDNYSEITLEISNIKNAMMILYTLIPMLEIYANSIDPTVLGSNLEPFDHHHKVEAISLLDCSIKKIIENERNLKIYELLKDEVVTLVELMEILKDNLQTNKHYDNKKCNSLLHQASWLVNIWQFHQGPIQISNLTESFHKLISLMNEINKENYLIIKNCHINKESSREYWFDILQNWQNRSESLLTMDTSITESNKSLTNEWKQFHDRMYLVAEFQQIDANIDHYSIEFEADFVDCLQFYRGDMDKINKSFIDELINRKEPIFQFLKFISNEIKELEKWKIKVTHTSDSFEGVQRSTQTSLHVLEYLISLLDKVDENYCNRTDIVNEQIRKLRVEFHSLKKAFLIQNNYYRNVYEEVTVIGASMDKIEKSIDAVEILIERDINTLMADAFLEMFNRCEKSMNDAEIDINNAEIKLKSISINQSKVIIDFVESLKLKIIKIKKSLIKIISKSLVNKRIIISIREQQKQTSILKSNLDIYFTKFQVYFSNIDMKEINSKESAENYLCFMDQLFSEMELHRKFIDEFEVINYKIINGSIDGSLLKSLFDKELNHFMNNYQQIDSFKSTRNKLSEKLKILSEIENKYKLLTIEIDQLKDLIFKNDGNSSQKISHQLETIRYKIDNSINYLHDVLKSIDRNQMDLFVKNFEQLELLIDVYDELVNEKKTEQNQRNKTIGLFKEKKEQYFHKMTNCHDIVKEILVECALNEDLTNFLCQMEKLLSDIIQIRNEILIESVFIYVNDLKHSEMSKLYEECFQFACESLKTFSTIIIDFLLNKFIFSGDLFNVFYNFCDNWMSIIRNCMDCNADMEYHRKLDNIETIQVMLQCFQFVTEQCDKLALSKSLIVNIGILKSNITESLYIINSIVNSTEKLNLKISIFHLLRYSLSRCTEKLNVHFLLVQSLSEDCSVQKHIYMKQQSIFYRAFIKHHKTQYQLFEKISDSILEENLLGFDFEDDIQTSLETIRNEIDGVSKKHSVALEEIDATLDEWEKERRSEVVAEGFMDLLDDALKALNSSSSSDKIKNQVFIERLKLVTQYMEENESQWSNLKIKTGSSYDQEYIRQKIKLTQISVAFCHMMMDYHSKKIDQSLCQYQELCWESKKIKCDVLVLINDLNCFYLAKELQISEQNEFLEKHGKAISEIEKTILIWHKRLELVRPDMIEIYQYNIKLNWNNIRKWFDKCGQINDEILLNHSQFIVIINTMQIKLNVIGEYIEKLESCDNFTKNIALNYHGYNVADLNNCLQINNIIIKQMEDIKMQLDQLKQLKDQLQQLMLGQNENENDYDKGKINNFEDVVDLIKNSQTSIKNKLLEIIQSSSRNSSKSILSFSSNEFEIVRFDKSISVSGDIDSFINISSNESSPLNTKPIYKKILPTSSIGEKSNQFTKDLDNIFNIVMASIIEQETFLNEKWNKALLNDENVLKNLEEMKKIDVEIFCNSTPKDNQLKFVDVHHWFPKTMEQCCQTIDETNNDNGEFIAVRSLHTTEDCSIICPNFNLTGLSDSIETSRYHDDQINVHRSINKEYNININTDINVEIFHQIADELSHIVVREDIHCCKHSEIIENNIKTNKDNNINIKISITENIYDNYIKNDNENTKNEIKITSVKTETNKVQMDNEKGYSSNKDDESGEISLIEIQNSNSQLETCDETNENTTESEILEINTNNESYKILEIKNQIIEKHIMISNKNVDQTKEVLEFSKKASNGNSLTQINHVNYSNDQELTSKGFFQSSEMYECMDNIHKDCIDNDLQVKTIQEISLSEIDISDNSKKLSEENLEIDKQSQLYITNSKECSDNVEMDISKIVKLELDIKKTINDEVNKEKENENENIEETVKDVDNDMKVEDNVDSIVSSNEQLMDCQNNIKDQNSKILLHNLSSKDNEKIKKNNDNIDFESKDISTISESFSSESGNNIIGEFNSNLLKKDIIIESNKSNEDVRSMDQVIKKDHDNNDYIICNEKTSLKNNSFGNNDLTDLEERCDLLVIQNDGNDINSEIIKNEYEVNSQIETDIETESSIEIGEKENPNEVIYEESKNPENNSPSCTKEIIENLQNEKYDIINNYKNEKDSSFMSVDYVVLEDSDISLVKQNELSNNMVFDVEEVNSNIVSTIITNETFVRTEIETHRKTDIRIHFSEKTNEDNIYNSSESFKKNDDLDECKNRNEKINLKVKDDISFKNKQNIEGEEFQFGEDRSNERYDIKDEYNIKKDIYLKLDDSDISLVKQTEQSKDWESEAEEMKSINNIKKEEFHNDSNFETEVSINYSVKNEERETVNFEKSHESYKVNLNISDENYECEKHNKELDSKVERLNFKNEEMKLENTDKILINNFDKTLENVNLTLSEQKGLNNCKKKIDKENTKTVETDLKNETLEFKTSFQNSNDFNTEKNEIIFKEDKDLESLSCLTDKEFMENLQNKDLEVNAEIYINFIEENTDSENTKMTKVSSNEFLFTENYETLNRSGNEYTATSTINNIKIENEESNKDVSNKEFQDIIKSTSESFIITTENEAMEEQLEISKDSVKNRKEFLLSVNNNEYSSEVETGEVKKGILENEKDKLISSIDEIERKENRRNDFMESNIKCNVEIHSTNIEKDIIRNMEDYKHNNINETEIYEMLKSSKLDVNTNEDINDKDNCKEIKDCNNELIKKIDSQNNWNLNIENNKLPNDKELKVETCFISVKEGNNKDKSNLGLDFMSNVTNQMANINEDENVIQETKFKEIESQESIVSPIKTVLEEELSCSTNDDKINNRERIDEENSIITLVSKDEVTNLSMNESSQNEKFEKEKTNEKESKLCKNLECEKSLNSDYFINREELLSNDDLIVEICSSIIKAVKDSENRNIDSDNSILFMTKRANSSELEEVIEENKSNVIGNNHNQRTKNLKNEEIGYVKQHIITDDEAIENEKQFICKDYLQTEKEISRHIDTKNIKKNSSCDGKNELRIEFENGKDLSYETDMDTFEVIKDQNSVSIGSDILNNISLQEQVNANKIKNNVEEKMFKNIKNKELRNNQSKNNLETLRYVATENESIENEKQFIRKECILLNENRLSNDCQGSIESKRLKDTDINDMVEISSGVGICELIIDSEKVKDLNTEDLIDIVEKLKDQNDLNMDNDIKSIILMDDKINDSQIRHKVNENISENVKKEEMGNNQIKNDLESKPYDSADEVKVIEFDKQVINIEESRLLNDIIINMETENSRSIDTNDSMKYSSKAENCGIIIESENEKDLYLEPCIDIVESVNDQNDQNLVDDIINIVSLNETEDYNQLRDKEVKIKLENIKDKDIISDQIKNNLDRGHHTSNEFTQIQENLESSDGKKNIKNEFSKEINVKNIFETGKLELDCALENVRDEKENRNEKTKGVIFKNDLETSKYNIIAEDKSSIEKPFLGGNYKLIEENILSNDNRKNSAQENEDESFKIEIKNEKDLNKNQNYKINELLNIQLNKIKVEDKVSEIINPFNQDNKGEDKQDLNEEINTIEKDDKIDYNTNIKETEILLGMKENFDYDYCENKTLKENINIENNQIKDTDETVKENQNDRENHKAETFLCNDSIEIKNFNISSIIQNDFSNNINSNIAENLSNLSIKENSEITQENFDKLSEEIKNLCVVTDEKSCIFPSHIVDDVNTSIKSVDFIENDEDNKGNTYNDNQVIKIVTVDKSNEKMKLKFENDIKNYECTTFGSDENAMYETISDSIPVLNEKVYKEVIDVKLSDLRKENSNSIEKEKFENKTDDLQDINEFISINDKGKPFQFDFVNDHSEESTSEYLSSSSFQNNLTDIESNEYHDDRKLKTEPLDSISEYLSNSGDKEILTDHEDSVIEIENDEDMQDNEMTSFDIDEEAKNWNIENRKELYKDLSENIMTNNSLKSSTASNLSNSFDFKHLYLNNSKQSLEDENDNLSKGSFISTHIEHQSESYEFPKKVLDMNLQLKENFAHTIDNEVCSPSQLMESEISLQMDNEEVIDVKNSSRNILEKYDGKIDFLNNNENLNKDNSMDKYLISSDTDEEILAIFKQNMGDIPFGDFDKYNNITISPNEFVEESNIEAVRSTSDQSKNYDNDIANSYQSNYINISFDQSFININTKQMNSSRFQENENVSNRSILRLDESVISKPETLNNNTVGLTLDNIREKGSDYQNINQITSPIPEEMVSITNINGKLLNKAKQKNNESLTKSKEFGETIQSIFQDVTYINDNSKRLDIRIEEDLIIPKKQVCQSEYYTQINRPNSNSNIQMSLKELHDCEDSKPTSTITEDDKDNKIFSQSIIQRTSLTILPRKKSFVNLESNDSQRELNIASQTSEKDNIELVLLSKPILLSNKNLQSSLNDDLTSNIDNEILSDGLRKRTINSNNDYQTEKYIRDRKILNTPKTFNNNDKTWTFSYWKLFLIAFMLALVLILICLPLLPLVSNCNSPTYEILRSINPFYIKRSVPY